MLKRSIFIGVCSSVMLALLSACGGSDGGVASSNTGQVTSVYVFGDSLADSGSFGYKFTVNNAGPNGSTTPIWTERVATSYGQSVCPFFNAPAFSSPNAGCKSYSVGGSRVNSLSNTGGANVPFSIPFQLATAATVKGSNYSATDLILLDGGGNDMADLFGAFIAAPTTQFPGIVGSLVAAPSSNPVNAGVQYAQAVADKLADAVDAQLLNRGAQKVLILNTPDITGTPRFQLVLGSVAQASGATAAAGARAAAQAWVVALNARLNERFAGNSRVAVVDFATEFNTQLSNPAQFALGNVTTPACPVTGVDGQGLPAYDFANCTAANLTANGPADWATRGFADGFHPTPYAHQLIAQLVSRSLARVGWN